MAGFKDFTDGAVLTAAEIDGYLMGQTVMRFASAAARDAALAGVAANGMLAYTEDTSILWLRTGGSWRPNESAWFTFTPDWRSGAGGPVISIGNGTSSGRWRYSGGLVDFQISIVRGSTTNLGTTGYVFGRPVPAATFRNSGPAHILDASGPVTMPHLWHGVSTTEIAVVGTGGRRIDNNGFGTTPTAWATSDEIVITGRYEP